MNLKSGIVLTFVGLLGTTILPYLFLWQAREQVEDEIADGLILSHINQALPEYQRQSSE